MSFATKVRHGLRDGIDAVPSVRPMASSDPEPAVGSTAPTPEPVAPSVAPPPAGAPSPAPTGPPSPTAASAWLDRLAALSRSAARALSRPRVRSVVIGVVLILFGATVVSNSMWTLPLLIIGAIILIVAWVGDRLDGRVSLEWGEHGASIEMRARIKPLPEERPALPMVAAPAPPVAPAPTPTRLDPTTAIDGEAHTIEIDVAELQALIAAAESGRAEPEPTVDPSTATAPDAARINGASRSNGVVATSAGRAIDVTAASTHNTGIDATPGTSTGAGSTSTTPPPTDR
jgi:hypothetical protein